MLTWLRELAATVGTFDRSALEPAFALRCTAGVAIPFAIGAMLGHPSLGVAAAIGAFITGFTSLQGIYRTRLQAILIAAAGMSLASFIGALGAHSTPGIIAATAVAGYVCGTIGQIGPVASTVALNSLVAFVLFSSQALEPAAALQQSALVFGGGAIQAILVLIVWPTQRLDVERSALADVYRKLAEYARNAAGGAPSLPPITPLATARQVLSDPQPFSRAAEMARFERLLEDAEIVRRRLGALATIHDIPAPVAAQLDAIANVLEGGDAGRLPELPEMPQARDLAAQLRDAMLAASVISSRPLPNMHLLSRPRPGPYVENRVAWLSRDSLRYALVLGIAMVLARHFTADRGYWIPLTAAIVLKPDFQTTFVRGFARIGGTLIGAAVATGAMAIVRGNEALEVIGVSVTAAAAYLTFNPNYGLFTVAITSFVVLVLAMRGLPGTTTIDARILDTLAGGGLAMLGFLALPTWERKRTRALLADLLDAQRALASAILRAYAVRTDENRAAIDPARTAVWQTRTAVEASIDRTRHEPHRAHTIGAGRALRILAATQRFALSSLALETALETQPPPAGAGAVCAFADALDARMAELARALRASARAPAGEALPAALGQVENALRADQFPESSFVVDRLRAYVDATVRLARFIGLARA